MYQELHSFMLTGRINEDKEYYSSYSTVPFPDFHQRLAKCYFIVCKYENIAQNSALNSTHTHIFEPVRPAIFFV
jgi:hypothetical protein